MGDPLMKQRWRNFRSRKV